MRDYYKWLGSIAVICLAVVLTGGIDQTTKDALKVKHILRTIERQHPRSDGRDLTAEVTEKELNAYIANRLAQEKRPVVKSLKVDLLDRNHVQGKIRFAVDFINLADLLGDDLDFDFKGIFYTRDGAARLDLISLHLCGQPVKPQVLDYVLSTAARYYGAELGSSSDWYKLPKGIKRISVNQAQAVLYY